MTAPTSSLPRWGIEGECATFRDSTELVEVKRTGRIIKLPTVQEILDEEHVQKM